MKKSLNEDVKYNNNGKYDDELSKVEQPALVGISRKKCLVST